MPAVARARRAEQRGGSWNLSARSRDARPVGRDQQQRVSTRSSKHLSAGGPAAHYGGLTYQNLWPGIDLAYRGTGGRLKYEFVVQPGADPSQIRLAYHGASDLRIDPSGDLVNIHPGRRPSQMPPPTPIRRLTGSGRRSRCVPAGW
jgi:hypothetical protein